MGPTSKGREEKGRAGRGRVQQEFSIILGSDSENCGKPEVDEFTVVSGNLFLSCSLGVTVCVLLLLLLCYRSAVLRSTWSVSSALTAAPTIRVMTANQLTTSMMMLLQLLLLLLKLMMMIIMMRTLIRTYKTMYQC